MYWLTLPTMPKGITRAHANHTYSLSYVIIRITGSLLGV